MTLDQILQDKNLAHLKKKSEIVKTDFSNVLFEETNKAIESGSTSIEVLIYETTVSKLRNPVMFDQYSKGYVLNHSVGMRYIKLVLCINSERDTDKEEKDNWNKYYPICINKSEAEKRGFFWAVIEAKNVEGSAVVKGSNFLTPVLSIEFIDENTLRVKCAVSPCRLIDSHIDMHVPGCWRKTLNENTYDLFLQEHDMDFDKVIADSINDDLKVYTEEISVKELLSKFKKRKSEPVSTTPKNEAVSDTSTKTKSFFTHLVN